jgi:hypothetical protein
MSYWDFTRHYDRSAAMTALNIRRRTRRTILGPTSMTGRPWHGTYAYARGCSCDVCREANKQAQRQKRGGPTA